MFLVISNDLDWCVENLNSAPDVILENESSQISDIALLLSLDYHVVSFEMFGLVAALLSSPEIIAYPAPYHNISCVDHTHLATVNASYFVPIDLSVPEGT